MPGILSSGSAAGGTSSINGTSSGGGSPSSSFIPGLAALRGSSTGGQSNPYTQWAGGQYGVVEAQRAAQQSYYDVQGGQAHSAYDQGVGALNAGYGFDTRRLANDYTRLGADQGLQDGQVRYADANNALNGKRYGNQLDYLAQLGQLDSARFNEQGNYLGQMLGLSQTRYGNVNEDLANQKDINFRTFNNAQTTNTNAYDSAIRGASLTLDRAQSAALSSATTRGAVLSQGYGEDYGFNNRDYQNSATTASDIRNTSNAGAQISYDARGNDITAAGKANQLQWDTDKTNNTHDQFGNKLTYDKDKLNNDQSKKSNELQWQQDQNSYALAQQQNQRNQTYLDATASDYGIQGDQLKDTLQRGIDKLGLDFAGTMAQLGNLSSQNNNQAQAQKQAITYALLNAAQSAGGAAAAGSGTGATGKITPTPSSDRSNTQPISVPGYPGASRQTVPSTIPSGGRNVATPPGQVRGGQEPRVVDRDKNGNIIHDSNNPRVGSGRNQIY